MLVYIFFLILSIIIVITLNFDTVQAGTVVCQQQVPSFCGGTNLNDLMVGSNGEDNMVGRDGNDLMEGSNGNDIMHGYNGNDAIFGDAGSDILGGDNGDDTLVGDTGNDWLIGYIGADMISAGSGDDLIYAFYSLAPGYGMGPDGSTDIIDCGPGNDSVWINLSSDHDVVNNCETVHAG